jgi:hypothetical protein
VKCFRVRGSSREPRRNIRYRPDTENGAMCKLEPKRVSHLGHLFWRWASVTTVAGLGYSFGT